MGPQAKTSEHNRLWAGADIPSEIRLPGADLGAAENGFFFFIFTLR